MRCYWCGNLVDEERYIRSDLGTFHPWCYGLWFEKQGPMTFERIPAIYRPPMGYVTIPLFLVAAVIGIGWDKAVEMVRKVTS